jgi:hypothetical protein
MRDLKYFLAMNRSPGVYFRIIVNSPKRSISSCQMLVECYPDCRYAVRNDLAQVHPVETSASVAV